MSSVNKAQRGSLVDDVDCLMIKNLQTDKSRDPSTEFGRETPPNKPESHLSRGDIQAGHRATSGKLNDGNNQHRDQTGQADNCRQRLPVVSLSVDSASNPRDIDTMSSTSTSEVNSNDDAVSIASRLSQIVVEQEDKLADGFKERNHSTADLRSHYLDIDDQGEHATRSKMQRSVSQMPLATESQAPDGRILKEAHTINQLIQSKMRHNKSSNSLHAMAHPKARQQISNKRNVEEPAEEERPVGWSNKQVPDIQLINCDTKKHESCRPVQERLESRPRTKSMAERSIGATDEAETMDGFGQLRSTGLRRNESAGNFLPERGNLRSLELSRNINSQQMAGSADHQPRMRSNTAEGGQLMLNICRSTWTLHEFEQTFNKQPDEGSDVFHSRPSLDGSLQAASVDHQGGRDGLVSIVGNESHNNMTTIEMSGNSPAAPRSALERQISNRSSGGVSNLFMKASRNALNLQQQQQQQVQLTNGYKGNHQHTNNHAQGQQTFGGSSSSLNTAVAPNGCCNRKDSSQVQELPSGRRPSRAHSIGSFNSSVDSFCGGIPAAGRKCRRRKVANGKQADHDSDEDVDEHEKSGCCRRCCNMATLKQYLPILDWLPQYQWRTSLWGDLTAGLAVAVLNISTSLSAALVAETDLGAAFRSSIINTFIYALLCSSRHTSFGSWSIMSQMLLVSVRRALGDELILNRINLGPAAAWEPEEYEMWHMNIIIMYTFLIGLVQLVSGLLNLGNILASFIPAPLCSSMIAATAMTMAIGQLANMCGTSNKILWAIEKNTTELWADLKNPPVDITDLFAGLFRWIQQIALLVRHHEQINMVCVIISIVSVMLLALNQYVIQAQLKRLFKRNIFVPSELILLILMLICSHCFKLSEQYQVKTCGPIYIDFRTPNLPNLRLFRELWYDSLATALISYTMVFIMAKTYSNKLNYEIDCNQELIACGAGNLIGGLCDALPATASFSRTAGQVEAGGKTQMASFVNCVVLIGLAHFLGHYVAALPVCVMSATLFYGFLRMATRITEALHFWRLCKVDFAIWVVTFVAILTLDMVNGFLYGFIFSILTMLYRAQNRRCYLLGSIGTSDVYVPLAKYPLAKEIDGIKIFQFCGPIHYVCADLFEQLLRQKTRVNVKQLIAEMETTQEGKLINAEKFNPLSMNLPSHIILDFSMISYIDSAGIHIIKKIIEDNNQLNITVLLASLASHVAAVVKSEPTLWNVYKERFYVTLADAVHCAMRDSQRFQRIAIQNLNGNTKW